MMISTLWPTRRVRGAAAALGAVAAAAFCLVVVGQSEWAGLIGERMSRGKKPRLEDYVFEGQWHAAVLTTVLCLGLALTARYWVGGDGVPGAAAAKGGGGGAAGRPAGRGRWWFLGVLVLVVAGAAWLRAPRMTHSLYNDEEYMFRRYVAGEHKPLPDGSSEWRPVSWLGTLWGNQMGNNGVLYSLLSRACYDGAVAAGRARATLPAEVPLRVPAMLAGLGSIGVIALLACRLGGPVAGVAAAVLAALHPWHVRYSTEARGHSLVLLLAPLLPLVLARAVDSGRWRWWVVFGAVEVGLLWAFAGSVYYVAAFNFLALVWLWRRGGGVWCRFLAVHVMAAMVYLHLMAPCFPQIRAALAANDVFSAGLGPMWFANTGSFLFAGMPWENANPEIASHPSLGGVREESPLGLAVTAGLGLVLLGAGVVRAWASTTGRLVVLTLPLAAFLAVAATLVGRSVLFSWYVLFLLPGVLVLGGVGTAAAVAFARARGVGGATTGARGQRMSWRQVVGFGVLGGGRTPTGARRRGLAVLLLPGLAFLCWLSLISAPLRTYRAQGKQALREVARFLRTPVDGVLPLAVLHASEAGSYDPSIPVIGADPVQLREWVERAETEGRPLLVGFGYRPVVAASSPAFLRAIEESGDFERVAHFPGLEEPQFAHHIWRHRPRSVGR